jgi:hypothetical protein
MEKHIAWRLVLISPFHIYQSALGLVQIRHMPAKTDWVRISSFHFCPVI